MSYVYWWISDNLNQDDHWTATTTSLSQDPASRTWASTWRQGLSHGDLTALERSFFLSPETMAQIVLKGWEVSSAPVSSSSCRNMSVAGY